MAYSKTNWVNNTTPINETNLNKIESGIKNNDINIGEENYDNTKTYEVGDIVRYNEKIYKCITAITTAENFDSSKWEQTNIVEIVQSEKSKIYELIEAISTPIVGEGENITLNDTAEKRFENFDIEGNSEQETRKGYNLLNLTSLIGKTETKNGVTYKINEDCSITVNGTPTDYTSFNLLDMSLKAGTYKFTDGLNSNNVFLQTLGNFQEISQNRTFSLAEDGNGTLNLVILAGTPTLNNTTLYPMIYEGTEDKPYEQYGAMPSPDYPSEIKTVGDNINLLPSDLFSSTALNGVNYTNKDGIITVNGTATENSFYTKTITLKAGTYTLNGSPKGSEQDRYCLQAQGLGAGDFGSGQTFTIDTEKQVTLRIMVWKGITVNNIIFKPKLIKGTEVGEYSKFGQGCVKVTKCNKNIMPILNLGNNYEYTGNGIKSLKKNNGVEVTRFKVRKGQTIKIGLKMISRPAKDSSYTIYFKDNNNSIAAFTHINDSSYIELNKVYEKSYTANEDGEIFIKLWGNTSSDVFEFQLWAELDNLTEYEQHEEQSYIMPVQKEMLEGDYFDWDNEEEVNVWGKKILDGTEEINLQWDASDKHGYRIAIDNIKKTTSSSEKSLVISNSYKAYIQDDLFNLKYKAYGISNRYNNSEVIIRNDDITTVADFKAYLKSQYDAGTPVVVYYQLATPTRLAFTDEQKTVAKKLNNARTYKNVTHIYSNDEVSPNCYVEAVKDLTTLIQ